MRFVICLLLLINFVVSCTTAERKPEQFNILLLGDPQVRSANSIVAFRDDVLCDVAQQEDIAFGITLGDLADDSLAVYGELNSLFKATGIEFYHIFGNHDITYSAKGHIDQSVDFSRHFGATDFRIDRGQVTILGLNNVIYQGWNHTDNQKGNYFGGLTSSQFEWIEQQLELTPSDNLIVLCAHIPFLKDYMNEQDIISFFSLLQNRKHLVAFTGHLHTVQNYYFDDSTHWKGRAPFMNLTVGSTCGSWWCGPLDERGLPSATSVDGTPNGYYRISFIGNRYKYRFIPASQSEEDQIRLNFYPDTKELYANIFTASPLANVSFRISGCDSTFTMTRSLEADPYIINTHSQRINGDMWSPSISSSTHLWKADLQDFPKGIYRVDVVASDDGYRYTTKKIIKI